MMTDAGRAHVKFLGNPQGPHALAADWVGTHLARWLGLPTLAMEIVELDETVEVQLASGDTAHPGPAVATRTIDAVSWSGTAESLKNVENIEDVSRLVVFDTWTRNCDRYLPGPTHTRSNPDNILLTREGASEGRQRLIPIDHGDCFDCGRDLNRDLSHIDKIRDDRVYGLFPAFQDKMDKEIVTAAAAQLAQLDENRVGQFVDSIPSKWEVPPVGGRAMIELIVRRANYIADNIVRLLAPSCWPQGEFDFRQ